MDLNSVSSLARVISVSVRVKRKHIGFDNSVCASITVKGHAEVPLAGTE